MTTEPNLADDVLDYLLRYPDAEDTVEGIAQWWLAEQRAAQTLAAVQRAVAELEAQGFLVKTPARPGPQPVRFRLNAARTHEVRRHLAARRN
jgi:hypothetical protein